MEETPPCNVDPVYVEEFDRDKMEKTFFGTKKTEYVQYQVYAISTLKFEPLYLDQANLDAGGAVVNNHDAECTGLVSEAVHKNLKISEIRADGLDA